MRSEIGRDNPDRRDNTEKRLYQVVQIVLGFMDTFCSYMSEQCGIIKTMHIFSCSVDCQALSQREGLSVSSTTQGTQTMSGELTGT